MDASSRNGGTFSLATSRTRLALATIASASDAILVFSVSSLSA